MAVIGAHADSMVGLLCDLVAHPSQGGIDSPQPVLATISRWLDERGIPHHWLRDDNGLPLGLAGELAGQRPGPGYVLNACADTAPFGDPGAWHHPPDRPTIADGWLYGRGSADSKAGIAIFCHVLAELAATRGQFAGHLGFLFDAEEHTGTFAGIHRYIATHQERPIDGVMIGYPGNDRLVTGGRGFLRARITFHGLAAHSGASSSRGINAIDRATLFLTHLASAPLPTGNDAFPLPPKATVTGITGGGSFSLVPDQCTVDLDLRLTPSFGETEARTLIGDLLAGQQFADIAPNRIEWLPGWPACQLDPAHPMVRALGEAACQAFGHEIPPTVVGPSSIANYLATLGIPATAGLGVTYRDLHAPNECVQLDTLQPTFLTYREALRRLLDAST